MKARNFKTFLPCFVGFYNSFLDFDEIFEDEMNEINNERECKGFDILDFYSDVNFDYVAYNIKVSQLYCEVMQSVLINELDLNCKIKYESLYSPKEYNFKTDSVNIEIKILLKDQKVLNNLIKENYDQLASLIKDGYTSRDGFNSFYSNNIDEWLNPNDDYYLHCSHKLGAMLEMLIKIIFDVDKIKDIIFDEISSNISMSEFTDISYDEMLVSNSELFKEYTETVENSTRLWNETQCTKMPKHLDFETWKYLKENDQRLETIGNYGLLIDSEQ